MNPSRSVWAILLLVLCATIAKAQPDDEKAGADERDPSHKRWQWMFELRLPDKVEGAYLALPISPEVFGKAQMEPFGQDQMERIDKFPKEEFGKFPMAGPGRDSNELRDLRLADAKGNRIPYVLRIMRDYYRRTDAKIVRTFNAAPSPKSRIFEASYELADVPAPGHNEIEIRTAGGGRNFRRKVEVFGDDNDQFTKPKSLLGKGKYLVHYEVDSKVVDIHRFHYDEMQYRFLQVRVHADDVTVDEEIPTISSVVVRRRIEMPGELVTLPARFDGIEQVRGDGGPGTAWLISLPDRMPCEKLTFEINGEPSERPMRLEIADPDQPRRPVYGVDWQWRKEENPPAGDKRADMPNRSFLDVRFNEVVTGRLRLVITDRANPPLSLHRVEAAHAARKLIFENAEVTTAALPLRLYVGNPTIGLPGYVDLAKKLPEILKPLPPIATLEKMQDNPTYEKPPQKLEERLPWLVHVVLGAASLVLLMILGALARQAIQRHDQVQPSQAATGSPTSPKV